MSDESAEAQKLPQLQEKCYSCSGHGSSDRGGSCRACNGTGWAPTEAGEEILSLVRNHLRLRSE